MTTDLNVLLVTAASIGFLHTLTGPDHYLPFIVMSKARNWSLAKTVWLTFLCGLGHVGSSIAIGAAGIALGIGVQRLVIFENFRGNLAAWAFIIFGFIYFLWGLWRVKKNKPHKHLHFHADGSVHAHQHSHVQLNAHVHTHPHVPVKGQGQFKLADQPAEKPVNLTPWILFTVFVLGPCEPLIPILMYPAATANVHGIIIVSAVFSFITISTMISIVVFSLYGINFLPMKMFEKYMHALAGATICVSGLAIVFLGL
jgi:sulfite exporter TauE/SafE